MREIKWNNSLDVAGKHQIGVCMTQGGEPIREENKAKRTEPRQTPYMAKALRDRISDFARLGTAPGDSEEVTLRKSALFLSAVSVVTLAFAWVITYWVLGLELAATIPFTYQVISAISISIFIRTKRWVFFRNSQLLLMLLLPFLLQWTLGGFVSSSAVMLWALMAPIGALVFAGPKQSVPWLIGFLALAALSGFLESSLTPAPIPVPVVVTFFVMNLGTVSAVVFMLLRYFVMGRESALGALRHEHELLETEREKSERLLLNVLPESIAVRLKEGEEVIADNFESVTVLFADIVGFTPLAERISAEKVIHLLNSMFSAFDGFADEEGLEKIKTIGDAYMVAGGLPNRRSDHAEAVARVALRMRDYTAQIAGESVPLNVRIGMAMGSVVAGVIGRRKFSYDMWGDTVNTASRMESHGVTGKIQVTGDLYDRLKDEFEFKPRGQVELKGKGLVETYLLEGLKTGAGEG